MIKLGVVMDPITTIKPYKDTSVAMLLAAQTRNWELYYLPPEQIWLQQGRVWGNLYPIKVQDDAKHWCQLDMPISQPLNDLDVLLMRKDPPFNMKYIHLTYLLEQAQAQGLMVLNHPASLRDANEKLFTAWFPQCCPTTIVTSQKKNLDHFLDNEKIIVIKPLDGMGGQSIFKVKADDPNRHVIMETLTQNQQQLVMAQTFIPAIDQGDKRIILIDGEPIPYCLARIPPANDFRGNIAIGATTEGRSLSEHDRWICSQVGPKLREKGLLFVGLDVIGDYLTEINVTSPTGVRELDQQFSLNIADQFLEVIVRNLE